MKIQEYLENQITNEILDGMVRAAINAFGEGMTRKEVEEHIFGRDRVYVAEENSQIVGFATSVFKNNSLYLGGAVVEEKSQGRWRVRTTRMPEN